MTNFRMKFRAWTVRTVAMDRLLYTASPRRKRAPRPEGYILKRRVNTVSSPGRDETLIVPL